MDSRKRWHFFIHPLIKKRKKIYFKRKRINSTVGKVLKAHACESDQLRQRKSYFVYCRVPRYIVSTSEKFEALDIFRRNDLHS